MRSGETAAATKPSSWLDPEPDLAILDIKMPGLPRPAPSRVSGWLPS
jgi:hypothetical protein